MDKSQFEKEIEQLINKYSLENNSGTPDFILAKYLADCLKNFEQTTIMRESWYGRSTTFMKSIT